MIRSGTKVTKQVIEAGQQLKKSLAAPESGSIIVDVPRNVVIATRRGIVGWFVILSQRATTIAAR